MWVQEPLLRQERSHLLQALGWLRPPLKVPNMWAPEAHPPRLALRVEHLLLRQEVSSGWQKALSGMSVDMKNA
jgi:hypothetical protein